MTLLTFRPLGGREWVHFTPAATHRAYRTMPCSRSANLRVLSGPQDSGLAVDIPAGCRPGLSVAATWDLGPLYVLNADIWT